MSANASKNCEVCKKAHGYSLYPYCSKNCADFAASNCIQCRKRRSANGDLYCGVQCSEQHSYQARQGSATNTHCQFCYRSPALYGFPYCGVQCRSSATKNCIQCFERVALLPYDVFCSQSCKDQQRNGGFPAKFHNAANAFQTVTSGAPPAYASHDPAASTDRDRHTASASATSAFGQARILRQTAPVQIGFSNQASNGSNSVPRDAVALFTLLEQVAPIQAGTDNRANGWHNVAGEDRVRDPVPIDPTTTGKFV